MQNFVRKMREANDMTLEQAADLMGVTKAQVSKMERGLIRLNDEWLDKLSHLYKCSIHDLIDDDKNKLSAFISAPLMGFVDARQVGLVEEKGGGIIRLPKPKNAKKFKEYFSLGIRGELLGQYNEGDTLVFGGINSDNSDLLKNGSIILYEQKDNYGNPCGRFIREIEVDETGLCFAVYKIRYGQKAFSKPVRELLMEKSDLEKYLNFEKSNEPIIPIKTQAMEILGVLVLVVVGVS